VRQAKRMREVWEKELAELEKEAMPKSATQLAQSHSEDVLTSEDFLKCLTARASTVLSVESGKTEIQAVAKTEYVEGHPLSKRGQFARLVQWA